MDHKDNVEEKLNEEKKTAEEAGPASKVKGILSQITSPLITGCSIRLISAENWTLEHEKYENTIRQGREIAIIKTMIADKAQYQIFYKNTVDGAVTSTPIDCDEPLTAALNNLKVDLSKGSKILTKVHNQDANTEKVYQLVSEAVTAAHGQPPAPAGRFEFLGILLEQIFNFFISMVPVIKDVAVPMIENITGMLASPPKADETPMDVVKQLVAEGNLDDANTRLQQEEVKLLADTKKALEECNKYENKSDSSLKDAVDEYGAKLKELKSDLDQLIITEDETEKTDLVEHLAKVQEELNQINEKITGKDVHLQNSPVIFIKSIEPIVEAHKMLYEKAHPATPSA